MAVLPAALVTVRVKSLEAVITPLLRPVPVVTVVPFTVAVPPLKVGVTVVLPL